MSAARRYRLARTWASLLGVVLATAQSLGAQVAPGGRRVEVYGDSHRVTGGFGDWTGIGSRIVVPAGPRDVWFVESLARRAFGDAGVFLGGANQHVWSDRWYSFAGLGAGTGEFVLPDLRLDASLSRKWGASRSVVSTLGATLVDAKLGYRDVGGFGAVTAYLAAQAIVEGGVRVTRSTPGNVDATRGFGAVTLGREGRSYLVVRGSSGGEGYQLLGPDAAVRRFTSHEGGLAWRQWVGGGAGFLIQGDRYVNPFYTRTGVTVGLFAHW